jgi:hypothetical protein
MLDDGESEEKAEEGGVVFDNGDPDPNIILVTPCQPA